MLRTTVSLDRVAELSDADREDLRALSAAVYPPRETTEWAGRNLEWAAAEWCVRVRGENGVPVSYVGISVRDAQHDGRPVRIGGIGGVKTHPAARRQGLASRGMERAMAFFHAQPGLAFALLVCRPELIAHYERQGWVAFAGRLLVCQHGATVEFTFNRVMTRAVVTGAPERGLIDLLGPPW